MNSEAIYFDVSFGMGKLILVRHGETEKNTGNRLHSAKDSEGLNTSGREQLKKVAVRLKAYLPFRLYSSKELRAVESAKIIEQNLLVKNDEIDGLEERNWGVYADKPWSDVKAVLDKLSLEERYLYIPEKGESWKSFETRLVSAISSIIEANSGRNVVIITHGGSIRALMPFLLDIPKEESFKYDPSNASISVFDYNDGVYVPETVDDTSHLG